MKTAAPSDVRVPELAALGMTKRFGALTVLHDVSLTLRPGSFHALLGENGAGKSTLVKCIMGYYQADAGAIHVGGTQVTVRNPRDAHGLGIGMVFQHFTLVSNMTVAENLVMARPALPMVIDWRKEESELRAFMKRMPFQIEPTRRVQSLAAGERQKLEILKQLYLGSRIIILDEPTSVLTPAEADEVLGMLRDKATAGEVSVLMISHKFREVTRFADEVTVLRRGGMAGRGAVADLNPAQMAKMMVGGEPPKSAASRAEIEHGPIRLALDGVEAKDDKGLPILRGVTFVVAAGEIVGIAGVSGNGQDQLVEVLAGQRELEGGQVLVGRVPYRATRDEAREHRVRCIPEEPLRNACVGTMSVAENIGFRGYDRPPFTRGRWFVRRSALRKLAAARVVEYRIKASSLDAPIASLSGGNVQRAVLARELDGGASVLIAANPCFGLDFAAVAEIRSRILEARNQGAAVLLVSADLDEIFALSDRILVMSEGRIVHETKIADADVGTIGACMAGHAQAHD